MEQNNTFVVSILYTRHSSWQGSVDWISKDGKKTRCFRSVLELIRLMDEAVGMEQKQSMEPGIDMC